MSAVMTAMLLQAALPHPPAPPANDDVGRPPERVLQRVEADCPKTGHIGVEMSVRTWPRQITLDRLIGGTLRENDRRYVAALLAHADAIRLSGVMCNYDGSYTVGVEVLEDHEWRSGAMIVSDAGVVLSL